MNFIDEKPNLTPDSEPLYSDEHSPDMWEKIVKFLLKNKI